MYLPAGTDLLTLFFSLETFLVASCFGVAFLVSVFLACSALGFEILSVFGVSFTCGSGSFVSIGAV
ncbi:MAG: hypothetical protein ACOCM0_01950 [Campylobacter hyointestinalis]